MALSERKRIAYPYITRRKGVSGGHPVIEGTRIPVSTIVCAHQLGMDFDEILVQYPGLRPEQLHAALLYYFDHKAEIDAILSLEKTPLPGAKAVEV